jgi:lysine-N-methylase
VQGEEERLERIAAYFLFRYLLKAVNDGDLLGRVQLCVLSVLTVEKLAAVCGLEEALRRFSCEIEHSDVNLDALLEALWQSETFAFERFEKELSAT